MYRHVVYPSQCVDTVCDSMDRQYIQVSVLIQFAIVQAVHITSDDTVCACTVYSVHTDNISNSVCVDWECDCTDR